MCNDIIKRSSTKGRQKKKKIKGISIEKKVTQEKPWVDTLLIEMSWIRTKRGLSISSEWPLLSTVHYQVSVVDMLLGEAELGFECCCAVIRWHYFTDDNLSSYSVDNTQKHISVCTLHHF